MSLEGVQGLMEALAAKQSAIVREWLGRTLQSYPEHTGRFLAQEQDPFRNPVGQTLRDALPAIFEQLVGDVDAAALRRLLDPIVRIRAVQDFSAGQAVAFLFLLKPVVREALRPHIQAHPAGDALAILEGRIDQMALLAFDLFMQCRAQVYEIKANETRRRTEILLRRHDALPRLSDSPIRERETP
ncbi:MAG: RsbRD N-terminal domain-containing protein [candidate division NC10 bacterium]|nr:RsbRD N-terminal domain-containing protein [candidate division NC10 bacterium]